MRNFTFPIKSRALWFTKLVGVSSWAPGYQWKNFVLQTNRNELRAGYISLAILHDWAGFPLLQLAQIDLSVLLNNQPTNQVIAGL